MSEAQDRARDDAELSLIRVELLSEIRACLLDPLRPAQGLLEDLLSGIYGCWLVYSGSHGRPGIYDDDDDDDGDDDDGGNFEQELCDAALASSPSHILSATAAP